MAKQGDYKQDASSFSKRCACPSKILTHSQNFVAMSLAKASIATFAVLELWYCLGKPAKNGPDYQYHTLRITSSCFVTGQAHSEHVFHTFLQATHHALLQLPSKQACDQLLNLLQAQHHLNPEWNLVNQMITLSCHLP